MSDDHFITGNRDTLIENFAAELTSAVYPLVLQHGTRGSWFQMELDLWRVLVETVKSWAREWPLAGSPDELKVWRQGLLVDLTENAFYVAMKLAKLGSFRIVGLDISRSFVRIACSISTFSAYCSRPARRSS